MTKLTDTFAAVHCLKIVQYLYVLKTCFPVKKLTCKPQVSNGEVRSSKIQEKSAASKIFSPQTLYTPCTHRIYCDKSLHMVLGSGGSDETGYEPGLLIFSSPVMFTRYIAFALGRSVQ